MKKYFIIRKIGLLLILCGLLLATAGCGGGKGSNTTANTGDTSESLAAKETINAYFTAYFNSQKELSYSKMSSDILAVNDNTQINESFRDVILAAKKHFNTEISEYQYQINYQKVAISGEEAQIDLSLDLDFHYQAAPSDVKSAIYGVNYSFNLKNDGSKWVITQIDSDLAEYQYFKSQVQAEIAQKTTLSSETVINQVTQSIKNTLQSMNHIYLNGAVDSGATSEETTTASESSDVTASSSINKSVYVSCKSYNYTASAAVEYAETYATASTSNRIFYTISTDCTNFVSQCVWAGYVGFDASAIETAENYIENKIGMIYTEWHAGTGGGTTSWENVDELWSYLTDTTKSAGPQGVGYNNGGRYYNIAVSSINIGDVLQVKYGSGTDFDHSVFVTSKNSTVSNYSDILISSHTNNRLNFSLMEVIDGFGGYSKCYMRRIALQSGCYMK